ncbi:MAG: CCA tRNA nucleotidyltransferase [Thermodesulfobacteriota bacterium]
MHGQEAYIVGGAVRDFLMARPATDWDVVTSADQSEIDAIFNDVNRFSLKHQTVTLVHGVELYEVTPFRGAGTKGRDLEEDLAHRDFTIDAMAYDVKEERVIDPHRGREDISRRLVRAVGDPTARLREDPLRLLRAVRLAGELGFKIEQDTLEAISRMAGRIDSVANERIRDELLKILLSPRPSAGITLLRRTGLLKQILPELLEGYGMRQNPQYHRYTVYRHTLETLDRVQPEPVLRLTALLHDVAKPRVRERIAGKFRFYGHAKVSAELARGILERLKFDQRTIGLVTHLISLHMRDLEYRPGWSDGAVRRLVRAVGADNVDPFLGFRKADLAAHGVRDEKQDLFSHLENRIRGILSGSFPGKRRDLAIDGHKVMDILGLSPGPEVGRALGLLLEKVMDDPGLNSEEKLVAVLKGMKRE